MCKYEAGYNGFPFFYNGFLKKKNHFCMKKKIYE